MAAYSGWGGQADAFLEDLSGRPQWAEVHDDLRELLTDEEYAAARASTLTAFYTPQPVAMAMVRALSTLGIGASGTSEVLGCRGRQPIGPSRACDPPRSDGRPRPARGMQRLLWRL